MIFLLDEFNDLRVFRGEEKSAAETAECWADEGLIYFFAELEAV